MRKLVSITTICFIIVALFSGCTLLQKLGLQDSDELHPVSSIVMGEDEAKKLSDKLPVHLYFANQDNTKLMKEIKYVPVDEAKKSVNNLASLIVEELIKGPSAESGLKATIPPETKLKSKVRIDAATRTATVDFSKEFVDKHPGSKAEERMTIYSIVNSLTELKDIEKVKFLVEGKSKESFKGNFQFNVPFPRTVSLISKETVSSSIDTDDSKDASNAIEGSGDGEVDVDSSDEDPESDDVVQDLESEEILE